MYEAPPRNATSLDDPTKAATARAFDRYALTMSTPPIPPQASYAANFLSAKHAETKMLVSEKALRRALFEKKLSSSSLPNAEKERLLAKLEEEESALLAENLTRLKPTDFESLRVVGRGAFGEVRLFVETSALIAARFTPSSRSRRPVWYRRIKSRTSARSEIFSRKLAKTFT